MKSKTTFRLDGGEKLNRQPNRPVIVAKAGYGYVWIGNDAPDDKACFATLSGKTTLLSLAAAIRRAVR